MTAGNGRAHARARPARRRAGPRPVSPAGGSPCRARVVRRRVALDCTSPGTLPEEDPVRNALLLAALFAIACPVAARAGLTLQHPVFSDAGAAPSAHLVPPLQLGSVALDTGAGAGGGTEPVLALILGIFPGFGLGHYVAGAAWQSWALIDGLLLIAAILVPAADPGVRGARPW